MNNRIIPQDGSYTTAMMPFTTHHSNGENGSDSYSEPDEEVLSLENEPKMRITSEFDFSRDMGNKVGTNFFTARPQQQPTNVINYIESIEGKLVETKNSIEDFNPPRIVPRVPRKPKFQSIKQIYC